MRSNCRRPWMPSVMTFWAEGTACASFSSYSMCQSEAEAVPGISNGGDRIYAVGLKSAGGARSWLVVQIWINAANCYQPGARQVDRCVLIACGFYATGLEPWPHLLLLYLQASHQWQPLTAEENVEGKCEAERQWTRAHLTYLAYIQ